MQYKDLQLEVSTLDTLYAYSKDLFEKRVNEEIASHDLAAFREMLTGAAGDIAKKILQDKTNTVNIDFSSDDVIKRELLKVFEECIDDVIDEVIKAPARKLLVIRLITGAYVFDV